MVLVMVFVEVFGYVVWIVIDGGVIWGYCVMGRVKIDNRLIFMIRIEIIYVKIGWLMKKCVMIGFYGFCFELGLFV